MYKNLAAAIAAASLVSTALAQGHATRSPAADTAPLKAAFVYLTPVLDAGWTRQHDEGRRALQSALGPRVRTSAVDSVPEGPDAERVLRDLAASGNRLIFTTSFGYTESVMRVARDFPQVRFESVTGFKRADNVATSNARYYEGRYLSGIAAGRASRTGVAGFVVGFPIPEVLQGINAFTLGMRSVNPKATVKVVWLDTWFDPPRERDAAMALFNGGVDVVSFQVASTAVMQAAQERGRMAIAYHSDMRKDGPDAQLLAVTHQWGDYYTARARAVLDGRWKSQDTWGGVREGMIRVEGFGPRLPAAVREEVLSRQREMAQGRLHPFKAGSEPIRDNQGRVRVPAGKQLEDAQILQMNWLVDGVQATLPQ
ncbi:Purine-binding protein BAB2_0673 precursor [Delftia tsuruhatensis]|uniref:BMP family ABC transporter substrate-binding protein n=1 Tax=Delftia tsuruhatensis TaxID=180282 RepID=UPI001E7D7EBB|nr:BMP family ABC transporter substrate-binding protein [Delftia tsuruhatensis]CAB5704273.1 Purine-binding protein BAB2_0673 precursor [Delftia tsuruhatensis]CAC9689799.1 Purine-binding protein BAB2_0673 precursor [Delftia tsuruhatensis]